MYMQYVSVFLLPLFSTSFPQADTSTSAGARNGKWPRN